MAESKKPGAAKIIDVKKPGKSAPAANSKSVIVNNRPLLKDPMVVDNVADPDDGSPAEAEPAAKAITHSELNLEPLLENEASGESDKPAASPEDQPSQPSDTEAGTATADSDEPEARKEAEAADGPAPDKSKTPDEKAPKPAKDKQSEAVLTEQTQRQAAIDKLADSKHYYLPINTVEKRRTKRVVILGVVLSLFLILAWVDIALDAGLIHLNGIQPLTHFFSS